MISACVDNDLGAKFQKLKALKAKKFLREIFQKMTVLSVNDSVQLIKNGRGKHLATRSFSALWGYNDV